MHSLWLFGLLHPFMQRMPREAAFDALRECVGGEAYSAEVASATKAGYMSEKDLEAVMALWAAADASGAKKGKDDGMAQEVEELSDP